MADPVNASIVAHFQTLEDSRIERTKKHLLLDILVIAMCTLLAGGEGFQNMELFGKSKRAWLQTFLALPYGIPSHDTFGQFCQLVEAETLIRQTGASPQSYPPVRRPTRYP